MTKNILELSNIEAKEFFLREESYFTFDLPKYFSFNKLLEKVDKKILGKNFDTFFSLDDNPNNYDNVNYTIFHNKNGKYSRRRLELINPAIYVSLVHRITEEENRKTIIKAFKSFKKGCTINCLSIPLIPCKGTKNKQIQANQWWENVEQKSISLSLEYNYLFETDIVDCYGSIYTHSIVRALHTKKTGKDQRKNDTLIGNVIDKHIQYMSNGQTNGIPQGSILMDFIAEMVLGYIDLEVTKKIKDEKINSDDFKILRYRDDYRIFVNDPNIGEKIIKILTIILSDVGMRINQEKTKVSDDIIYSSIKGDKLYLMQEYKYQKNIQKELLNMLVFSRKYNNSKQLNKMLQELFYKVEKRNRTYQNINVITAILADLAYHNPESYPIIASLLSKFLGFLKDNKERIKILEKITKKFSKIPSTEHFDIRLQRIYLGYNIENNYEGILCKKVIDNSIKIWSTNRLKGSLKTIIDTTSIIDKNKIKNLTKTVSKNEVEQFWKKKQYNY